MLSGQHRNPTPQNCTTDCSCYTPSNLSSGAFSLHTLYITCISEFPRLLSAHPQLNVIIFWDHYGDITKDNHIHDDNGEDDPDDSGSDLDSSTIEYQRLKLFNGNNAPLVLSMRRYGSILPYMNNWMLHSDPETCTLDRLRNLPMLSENSTLRDPHVLNPNSVDNLAISLPNTSLPSMNNARAALEALSTTFPYIDTLECQVACTDLPGSGPSVSLGLIR